jgi:uncharacterized FlaG/YvyC family protein
MQVDTPKNRRDAVEADQAKQPVAPDHATQPAKRAAADAYAQAAQPQSPAVAPPVELHYALDPVANIWVAHVLDGGTGEVIRTVPSTKVLHQLAELQRQRVIDARA